MSEDPIVLPLRYINIEEECKRNPQLKVSDLQILKDWMDKQKHLPNIPTLYLVMFLHSNYYYIEPTKITIENFFTVRTHLPEIFYNRDPVAWKGLRKAFNVVAFIPLAQKTKENYIMMCGKLLDSNTSNFNYTEVLKYLFMTCEVQNVAEGTNSGLVVIFDATGFSLSHMTHLNLIILKKILFFVQEAAPVKMKAVHIINVIPAAVSLYSLLKPFLKKELLDIIYFHRSVENAKKFFPVEGLPNELGGQAGSLQIMVNNHIKLLEKHRAWFKYDEIKGRVNESLRVGKFQAGDGMFGVDGSFKKFEID